MGGSVQAYGAGAMAGSLTSPEQTGGVVFYTGENTGFQTNVSWTGATERWIRQDAWVYAEGWTRPKCAGAPDTWVLLRIKEAFAVQPDGGTINQNRVRPGKHMPANGKPGYEPKKMDDRGDVRKLVFSRKLCDLCLFRFAIYTIAWEADGPPTDGYSYVEMLNKVDGKGCLVHGSGLSKGTTVLKTRSGAHRFDPGNFTQKGKRYYDGHFGYWTICPCSTKPPPTREPTDPAPPGPPTTTPTTGAPLSPGAPTTPSTSGRAPRGEFRAWRGWPEGKIPMKSPTGNKTPSNADGRKQPATPYKPTGSSPVDKGGTDERWPLDSSPIIAPRAPWGSPVFSTGEAPPALSFVQEPRLWLPDKSVDGTGLDSMEWPNEQDHSTGHVVPETFDADVSWVDAAGVEGTTPVAHPDHRQPGDAVDPALRRLRSTE